jgi:hypothetical protein
MGLESSSLVSDRSTRFIPAGQAVNDNLESDMWLVAEALISPDLGTRRDGFQRLLLLEALSSRPLLAYLLATRITEPDLNLRVDIVRGLGSLLLPAPDGKPVAEEVRRTLTYHLNRMRMRQVFSLLQVWAVTPEAGRQVACLLDACPYAGTYLVNIVNERKFDLALRQQAIQAIGQVGYLDALPALERLIQRVEARAETQRTLPLKSNTTDDETTLLPTLQETIRILQSP